MTGSNETEDAEGLGETTDDVGVEAGGWGDLVGDTIVDSLEGLLLLGVFFDLSPSSGAESRRLLRKPEVDELDGGW